MEWINFIVGMLGALVTAYMAKNEAIPEFRLFSDITSETMAEAARHHERSRKTAREIDEIQAEIKKPGLPSGDSERLIAVLKSSQEELRDERTRLKELEGRIRLDRFISRIMGFVFYVILGGAFGSLLTGLVTVEGVTGALPKAVESLVIGASWTTYLTAIGLKREQKKAVETGLLAASEKIDAAKKEIAEIVAQEVAKAEKTDKVDKPVNADRVAKEVAEKLDLVASEVRLGLSLPSKWFKGM